MQALSASVFSLACISCHLDVSSYLQILLSEPSQMTAVSHSSDPSSMVNTVFLSRVSLYLETPRIEGAFSVSRGSLPFSV